jgi:linoleoyl-CoA desaturase
MQKVSFNNKNNKFYKTLNERVDQYFAEKALLKTGNKSLYIKSVILILAATVCYLSLLIFIPDPLFAFLLFSMLGISQAGIGFNVLHDANHGSFSKWKQVNAVMSHTASILGINPWLWKQKHNIEHHTYTNIDGMDDDIAKSPFLRMAASQKHYRFHVLQYIYCVPLYALSGILMIISDFINYVKRNRRLPVRNRMNVINHWGFWAGKSLYAFIYIILPILILGTSTALIGFVIMHVSMGLIVSSIFQPAHLVEATHFEDGKKSPVINREWAVHQVESTANYATGNRLITWFAGGLNFQVEHHLFPRISHVHYPAIHEIVKDVCKQLSVQLHVYPTFLGAIHSHFRYMKKLGMASTV